MEKEKKGKKLIVLVVILIIVILGLVGYICYDKSVFGNTKDEGKIKEEKFEEKSDETGGLPVEKSDETGRLTAEKVVFDGDGKAVIKLNDEEITLYDNRGDDIGTFEFNDKVLIKTNFANIVNEVYTMKDILIIVTDGSDIRSEVIHIYDAKGNLIKEIYELDNNDKGMVLTGVTKEGSDSLNLVDFDNNKIIMSGWRVNYENVLVAHGKDIRFCNDSEIKSNNITDDYIVQADYELEYFGKYKFGEIKMTKITQDFKQMMTNGFGKSCNE